MPKKSNLTSTAILALAVGLFLFLSGVQTLIDFNSEGAKFLRSAGSFFGADQTANVVIVVVAILKIVSGLILAIGPFGLLTVGIRKLAFWIIAGFWAVFTVYASFFGAPLFKPTTMAWVQNLSLNVAILAAIWQLKPEGK